MSFLKRLSHWVPLEIKCRLHVKRAIDYFNIPIVINNFNRLDTLKILIEGLESRGYHNIYIVDNASTYPPLLDFYRECPHTVYRLNRNVGHLSIWETGIYKQFYNSYFAYTDADLQIHEQCPADFVEKFICLLRKYPSVLKVGFSLAIDDLPDCYVNKAKVTEWEKQFWQRQVEENVFRAPIDTTFAVYKPFFKGGLVNFKYRYLRVGFPYTIRHLPWYVNSAMPSQEDIYYVAHIKTSTHWSGQA